MKKLHTFGLCALVAPALTLNAGSAFAFNAASLESDSLAPKSQFSQSSNQLTASDQGGNQHDQTMSLSRTYLDSVPHNKSGMARGKFSERNKKSITLG